MSFSDPLTAIGNDLLAPGTMGLCEQHHREDSYTSEAKRLLMPFPQWTVPGICGK